MKSNPQNPHSKPNCNSPCHHTFFYRCYLSNTHVCSIATYVATVMCNMMTPVPVDHVMTLFKHIIVEGTPCMPLQSML